MTARLASSARAALLLAVAAASLAACRKKKPAAVPAPVTTSTTTTTTDTDAERARAEAARRAERDRFVRDSVARAGAMRDSLLNAARAGITAPVFFDYDEADIRDDSRAVLEAKLPILRANPSVRLRIGGHTDSRGADEYNLALGQRRAAAAKAFLTERGIDASRIEIASFGEERPLCEDDSDGCWSRNRRAEFEVTSGGATLSLPGGR